MTSSCWFINNDELNLRPQISHTNLSRAKESEIQLWGRFAEQMEISLL